MTIDPRRHSLGRGWRATTGLMTKHTFSLAFALGLMACGGNPASSDDGAAPSTSVSALTHTQAPHSIRQVLFDGDTWDGWFECQAGRGDDALVVYVGYQNSDTTLSARARYRKKDYNGNAVDSYVSLGTAHSTRSDSGGPAFTFQTGGSVSELDTGAIATTGRGQLTVGSTRLAIRCVSFDAPYSL